MPKTSLDPGVNQTELEEIPGRTLTAGDFTANEYTVTVEDLGQRLELQNGADAQINIDPLLLQSGKFVSFWNDDGFAYTFVTTFGIYVSEGDTMTGGTPDGDGKNRSIKANTDVVAVGSTDLSAQVKLSGKLSA